MRSLVWAIVSVVTVATAAHADDSAVDQANARARLATERAAAGDLLGAAAQFRAAYELDPRPEFLCNVGVAFHKAKDLPRAQLYLGQCLTRGGALTPDFIAAVRSAFAATEDALRGGDFAPIDLTVTPTTAAFIVSAFDRDDAIVGARLVWLPLGHHEVTVRADGFADRTIAVDVTTRTRQAVAVTLDKLAAVTPVVVDPPVTRQVLRRPSRRPALYATGATAGLAVIAGGLYLVARSAADDAGEAGIAEATYRDRVDRARLAQHAAWGVAAAAGVSAAISGYLWVRASRAAVVVEVVPVTDGGATAAVSGRF